MTTTTTTKTVHLQVAMFVGVSQYPSYRNLCNVLRGDFNGSAVGRDPIHSEGTTGHTTCPKCTSGLAGLGQSLDALAQTTATLAERERAFAARRFTWNQESFTGDLTQVVARLRSEADNLERLAQRFAIQPHGTASDTAREVLHQVLWMVPNMSLDSLVARAQELDGIAREAGLAEVK